MDDGRSKRGEGNARAPVGVVIPPVVLAVEHFRRVGADHEAADHLAAVDVQLDGHRHAGRIPHADRVLGVLQVRRDDSVSAPGVACGIH